MNGWATRSTWHGGRNPAARNDRHLGEVHLNILLFGASGMVGAGVLLECIDAPDVASILVIGRRTCGVTHPKLTEILLPDLFDIAAIRPSLVDRNACFFTLGVTAVGQTEESYHHLTCDLTLSIATALVAAAPSCVFVYVSGQGTDSSERGRTMWARVKGKTENALLALGFRSAFMFRPGIIQPLRGVRSGTSWYQAFYTLLGPLIPLVRRIAPDAATTTVEVGRAMIEVAAHGYPVAILGMHEINDAAKRYARPAGSI